MPPPPKILDSHIHLWPSTATSSTDHTWMQPGHLLTKQFSITQYDAATTSAPTPPSSFIYVETDRHLASASPAIASDAPLEEKRRVLKEWARAPLEECAFLRRLVTGELEEGDGANSKDGERLKGVVIWAPFHVHPEIFNAYMGLAREVLGEQGTERVVGFRYLLQGRDEAAVKALLGGEWFAGNVRRVCAGGDAKGGVGRKVAFDVGVDAHRDGIGAVESVSALVEEVGEGVNFVLNHLCKPDLSQPNWSSYDRWAAAITRLSSHPNVSMKLSGALNEFEPTPTPSSAGDILNALRPYLTHVLQRFGAHRILFGSDWPVCNVGGPAGEAGNWGLWAEVVQQWMEERALSEGERDLILAKAAVSAYGVKDF